MKFFVKISLILFTILAFTLASLFINSTVCATQFQVTDPYNDTTYTVIYSCDEVEITSSDNSTTFTINDTILDVACYNSVFSFLCISERSNSGFTYSVYFYNLISENLKFTSLDLQSERDTHIFTADKNETVYIADTINRNTLHIFPANSQEVSIQCPEYIKQLMCIDGVNILVFTAGSVYKFNESTLNKISSITPVAPCRYVSDGIISDVNGENFLYTEGALKPLTSASEPSVPELHIKVTDNYIYISNGTTYAALCKSFDLSKSEFKVYKQTHAELTSGQLGTGMSAVYENKEYIIIVTGDLTGEGNVNSRDFNALMKHLTCEIVLNETNIKAADVYSDDIVNTKDLLFLASLY